MTYDPNQPISAQNNPNPNRNDGRPFDQVNDPNRLHDPNLNQNQDRDQDRTQGDQNFASITHQNQTGKPTFENETQAQRDDVAGTQAQRNADQDAKDAAARKRP